MWESPIEFIENGIEAKLEDAVFEAVQNVGIHVDRDELLKALAYDRGQYEKGYADGVEDAESKIVRCKECKNYRGKNYVVTCLWHLSTVLPDDYCSHGERKDDA